MKIRNKIAQFQNGGVLKRQPPKFSTLGPFPRPTRPNSPPTPVLPLSTHRRRERPEPRRRRGKGASAATCAPCRHFSNLPPETRRARPSARCSPAAGRDTHTKGASEAQVYRRPPCGTHVNAPSAAHPSFRAFAEKRRRRRRGHGDGARGLDQLLDGLPAVPAARRLHARHIQPDAGEREEHTEEDRRLHRARGNRGGGGRRRRTGRFGRFSGSRGLESSYFAGNVTRRHVVDRALLFTALPSLTEETAGGAAFAGAARRSSAQLLLF